MGMIYETKITKGGLRGVVALFAIWFRAVTKFSLVKY